MTMEPIALTVSDTTKTTGFGKTTTYKLIKEGKLTVVKIGRRTLITVASIRALLEAGAA
jgi:excisionase family DNA binding protein